MQRLPFMLEDCWPEVHNSGKRKNSKRSGWKVTREFSVPSVRPLFALLVQGPWSKETMLILEGKWFVFSWSLEI